MKSRIPVLVALLLLALLPFTAPLHAQATIYVDDAAPGDPGPGDPLVSDPLEDGSLDHPYDAIQEGIDAAAGGDEVIVGPGLYTGQGNRDIDFLGKAITVRSLNGPDTCVVDCEASEFDLHTGFYIISGEGPDTVLEGFTVQNGYTTSYTQTSGGISCRGTSPVVRDCVVRDCHANDAGGGMRCTNGNPTIVDCRFEGNNTTAYGGGLLISGCGTVLIDRCRFEGNTIFVGVGVPGGAGINIGTSADVMIRDTVFVDNSTEDGSGGGLRVWECEKASILNCRFSGNSASLDGGGACVGRSSLLFASCIFDGNSAEIKGGGLCFTECSPDLTCEVMDTLITGNQAIDYGGAIHCYMSTVFVGACTLHQNSTQAWGGGTSQFRDAHITIRDSILWGNSALLGAPACFVGTVTAPSSLSIDHTDVEGGQASIHVQAGSTIHLGGGNIDTDPLFVSGPNGDFYLSQVAAGQATDSPCLDTGSAPADAVCWKPFDGTICLSQRSTRTDEINDQGTADMGAHHPVFSRIGASLSCTPSEGTVPFGTLISVGMQNELAGEFRQASGKLNVALANGSYYPSWRAGYLVLDPGEAFAFNWSQQIPATGSVIGENKFTLVVADVTPAPYNQPPYSPSGSTDRAWCTVTGVNP